MLTPFLLVRISHKKGHDLRHALRWLQVKPMVLVLKYEGPLQELVPSGDSWSMEGSIGTHSIGGGVFAYMPVLFGERLLAGRRCSRHFSHGH